MNQIGDEKHFMLGAVPVASGGSNIYSYVWKWWDGAAEATTVPAAFKVVNIGGNPDSSELHYSVTAVAVDGQEWTSNGTFDANNPPQIVQSPTISVNDAYLPFTTRIGLYAYDIEGDSLDFMWYSGSVYLSNGVAGTPVSVTGTWQGNGITDIRSYTASENHYYVNVFSSREVRCQVSDQSGGTTQLTFDLRGYPRPAPPSGVLVTPPNIFTDIRSIPVQRIYPGAYFDFEVIARDVVGGPLTFAWSFNGSNNWTVPSEGQGVTYAQLPDGSYRNVYRKDVSNEIVSSGTQKTVIGECAVVSQTARSDMKIEVILIKNSGPSAALINIRDYATGEIFADLGAVPLDALIEYEAVVTDPNNDVVTVAWVLTLDSPGVAAPTVHRLYGPKVIVAPRSVWNDNTFANPGCHIDGSATIYDRLGAGPFIAYVNTVTLATP